MVHFYRLIPGIVKEHSDFDLGFPPGVAAQVKWWLGYCDDVVGFVTLMKIELDLGDVSCNVFRLGCPVNIDHPFVRKFLQARIALVF